MLSPSFEYIIFPDKNCGTISEDKIKLDYLLKEGYNLLFQADNLLVLKILKDMNFKIDLIYIDPPYFAGLDEMIDVDLNSALNTACTIESKHFVTFKKLAYPNKTPPNDSSDVLSYCGTSSEEFSQYILNENKEFGFLKQIWSNINIESRNFCSWFYYRARFMKDLLSKKGILIVRFDYHFGHYAKLVLDSIFGSDHFIGEFMVRRMEKNVSDKSRGKQNQLNIANDSLFIYYNEEMHVLVKYPNKKRNLVENEKSNEELYDFLQIWLDPKNNVWMDIAGYEKRKKTFYPTENSVELLERIIECFSHEGTIIADFFAGSGVALSVASAKKRKWIGADLSQIANIQMIQRLQTQKISKFAWIRQQTSQTITEEFKKGKNDEYFRLIATKNEFFSHQTLKALNTQSAKKIVIISQSAIIEYQVFQDQNIEILHVFDNGIHNNNELMLVKSPEFKIRQKDNYLELYAYNIRDKIFSDLDFNRIKKYEYLIEYILVLTPVGTDQWICKMGQFGKILTTKKKREAPHWSFELSENMYSEFHDKDGKPIRGVLLEICDISGLNFKVLYSGGTQGD